jgi:hypothetical protein
MAEVCSIYNGDKNAPAMLVWRPEMKRPLVRNSRKLDTIKMNSKETGCGLISTGSDLV